MKVDKSKWVETAFAKIATSQLGKTLDANKNKGLPYPYLCAANVGMGYFNLSNVKEILLEDSELEKYLVRKGDLLICEGGDTGRCAIWESKEPIYYQNALHRVRFNDDIHNKFIMYYLHYYKKVGIIDKLSHGQTIKHFTQKGLSKLSFRMPTISEQKGIASELDAIQTMIDGYKAQITDLDELANSIFLETFGDPITNDKGWELTNLENVSNNNGSYGAGSPSAPKEPNRPRYIRITDIDDNGYLNNDFVVSSNIEDDTSYLLKFGDILFARTGATVGKTYLYTTSEPQIYAGYLIKFSLNIDVVSPIFIYHITKTEAYKYWLKNQIIGAAQPNVNAKKYSALPIILPPLVLQEEFAKKIKVIEKQKEMLFEQLADAEQLMAERMQYYFS